MTKRISRREALTYGAASLGAVSLTGLLAACGGKGSNVAHGLHPREDPPRQHHRAHHSVLLRRRLSASVFQREPYASDTGRDTFNTNDNIFDERLLLTLSQGR